MNKILIANRGEIAVRVMRTAKEMGISTVAVYSEADENSVHTRLADEAFLLGKSEPSFSYLNQEKIFKIAEESGADAIHPGYGFLSENSTFAKECEKRGIIFIGPSAEAMDKLGSKIDAKRIAVENDVPITPGYFQPGATNEKLLEEAKKIGFPLMLKASAGGGGRGMRIVRDDSDFLIACKLAKEESLKAFGDDAMMVEKYVENPRHIEVQILADNHGNVACLFERECSLQRRHQKVIEEAPSPSMNDDLWQKMKESSEKLVQASGYSGAGTVEYMYNEKDQEFYFLEVNARLQVEHPVTEAITGLDLVEWQIRIARGEKLELPELLMNGDRNAINGHAIECRIIAEDPANGFLPSIGQVIGWAEPKGMVRFDTGFEKGSEVTPYYDSLIAKLIVHHSVRDACIKRVVNSLKDTHILGIKQNISFLRDLISSSQFVENKFHTNTIQEAFGDWKRTEKFPDFILNMVQSVQIQAVSGFEEKSATSTAWGSYDGFRNVRTSS